MRAHIEEEEDAMGPSDTSAWGLKLLMYGALSY
jgi:hypothetical protein